MFWTIRDFAAFKTVNCRLFGIIWYLFIYFRFFEKGKNSHKKRRRRNTIISFFFSYMTVCISNLLLVLIELNTQKL
jgi:hypothetical protein